MTPTPTERPWTERERELRKADPATSDFLAWLEWAAKHVKGLHLVDVTTQAKMYQLCNEVARWRSDTDGEPGGRSGKDADFSAGDDN